MSELKIEANDDFYLDPDLGFNVSHHGSTTVMVLENSANATLIFGCKDADDNFVAYPNGEFSDGRIINHGKGAILMVRVSGISGDSVTIGFYPV